MLYLSAASSQPTHSCPTIRSVNHGSFDEKPPNPIFWRRYGLKLYYVNSFARMIEIDGGRLKETASETDTKFLRQFAFYRNIKDEIWITVYC